MKRFAILSILLCLCGAYVIFKATGTAVKERAYWDTIYSRFHSDSLIVYPLRGNIYSEDGKLLAANMPTYELRMDFGVTYKEVGSTAKSAQDSILSNAATFDTICNGLSQIIERHTSSYYRQRILEGWRKGARAYLLHDHYHDGKLTFAQYKELVALPLFRLNNANKSGGMFQVHYSRIKPFGSLCAALLGNAQLKDTTAGYYIGRSGIEGAYDTLLTGKQGMETKDLVRGKNNIRTNIIPAISGCDIITTINIALQDIAEQALRDRLEILHAEKGVCLIMEAATGDIKAMVNLRKSTSGGYKEEINHCLRDLMEPGSTFKPASLMVALDDGLIKIGDRIDTGTGVYQMYGHSVKDHDRGKNNRPQVISVPEVLVYSSNVGTARFIDNAYKGQEQQFVDGLKRVGMGIDLKLPFAGTAQANIRADRNDKTKLPWTAYGYATQVPFINTVTFYNAIANNGCLMKPRFVQSYITPDGNIIKTPTEVLIPQICKPQTLADIRAALYQVVYHRSASGKYDGTGKPVVMDTDQPIRDYAGCLMYGKTGKTISAFHISGKTGTAQVYGEGGYRNGEYLSSFCGYFPSEKPQYTMFIAIHTSSGPSGGGLLCGGVFKQIAIAMYAKGMINNV